MVRKILLVCILIFLTSCKSYNLSGKSYEAATDEKRVTLNFINDSLVEIQQEYLCEKLSEKERTTSFTAKYDIGKLNIKTFDENFKSSRFKSDILIVRNQDCTDCEKWIQIPDYNNSGCINTDLLDKRLGDKVKFGLVYLLPHDTLLIEKNIIRFGDLILTEQ